MTNRNTRLRMARIAAAAVFAAGASLTAAGAAQAANLVGDDDDSPAVSVKAAVGDGPVETVGGTAVIGGGDQGAAEGGDGGDEGGDQGAVEGGDGGDEGGDQGA